MKVLSTAQMRDVDRRTIELGIPGLILMENAASRVVDFLAARFAPLASQRIVVMCGKGNNGGDALAVARQLHVRFRPAALAVVLVPDPSELRGDAAENFRMLIASGWACLREIPREGRCATLVIDGLLGTGLSGPAAGPMLEAIRRINDGFPLAKIVAIDIPSGLPGDSGAAAGEFVHAHYTVTFTAPKIAQAMPPNCGQMGELQVVRIGSPDWLMDDVSLSLAQPQEFGWLLAPRPRNANKGDFGHVLVIGGAAGKTGAAAMSGLAALRAGAGLVTVACADNNLTAIAPALMTAPLEGVSAALRGKDVIAIGPGLGADPALVSLTRSLVAESESPVVIDADGLNALAQADWSTNGKRRVLTPHPGEMSRLTGRKIAEIESGRIDSAHSLATEKKVCLILKGQRTLVAFPDGRVSINPTGTPAMATAGSGDILTGLIAGFLAQFPDHADLAIIAAVYLHGLAGELGAAAKGEQSLIATDLLDYLPAAIDACRNLSDQI